MTDDEIKAMAEEAGLAYVDDFSGTPGVFSAKRENVDLMPYLRAFAELVSASLRERCATLVDDARVWGDSHEDMAAAIRALK